MIPPPPPQYKLKIEPPHAETNSSLSGLNSLACELKHYAAYYFAYPLWCVCVGGFKSAGGIDRKDPKFTSSRNDFKLIPEVYLCSNFFEIRRYFSKIAGNSADTAVNALRTADAPLS